MSNDHKGLWPESNFWVFEFLLCARGHTPEQPKPISRAAVEELLLEIKTLLAKRGIEFMVYHRAESDKIVERERRVFLDYLRYQEED